MVKHPIASLGYSEFEEIPRPAVAGHAGQFSLCEIGGRRVIFAQGRSHLYEGCSAQEVTAIVRTLGDAKVNQLIVTNAAGALDEQFRPGDLMMISDHLNLTGTSPLRGSANFVDLANAYSMRLRELFLRCANRIGLDLREGVYAAVPGPQYETPAEVRMFQRLGAQAIGMSTVLEVIQARVLDMEVAGFSCVTNMAAGLSSRKLSHEEVLTIVPIAAEKLSRLMTETLPSF